MSPRLRSFAGGFLVLAVLAACPGRAAAGEAAVAFSRSAATEIVSFREIWPEFADQDPTPLVRVYGDGRVVVHQAAYMKRRGVYETWLEASELEALLAELTPALLAFDEEDVAARKREAEAVRLLAAAAGGDKVLFAIADAEVSVFRLNIDGYRPPGPGPAIAVPSFERTWRGLGHDAERFPGLAPIQDLMRVESALRALADRADLVWLAPVAAADPADPGAP